VQAYYTLESALCVIFLKICKVVNYNRTASNLQYGTFQKRLKSAEKAILSAVMEN